MRNTRLRDSAFGMVCVFLELVAYLRVTAHLRYSMCTSQECSTGLVRFQFSELSTRGGQAMCMVNGVQVLSWSVKLTRV